MKILNKQSLIATVDAFNEAVLFGRCWQLETEALVQWLGSRLGEARAYAESLAMTSSDWQREFRLFTGERVTTRAARSHIIAEEALRMLTMIRTSTGADCAARRVAEERLGARIISDPTSTVTKDGIYCCGKCSIALWRALSAGAYRGQPTILSNAAKTLASSRTGAGEWKRFPFYYTVLFLSEADPEVFGEEIAYCSDRLVRARKLLHGKRDPVSERRIRVVDLGLIRLKGR
jgi:hypothetical protein